MSKETIKIFSWNVNGLRAAIRNNGFNKFLKEYDPDILCLQETKALKNQVVIDLPDYQEYWNSANKKGYSGTAIFTKKMPLAIHFGFPKHLYKPKDLIDDQGRDVSIEGRVIAAEFENFFLVNQYRPNSKRDLTRLDFVYKKWDPLFLKYCKYLEKSKPVIFCGDLNVAHKEIDLARPKDNQKNAGFTPEEREGFENLLKAGFVDIYRHFYPNTKDIYTWWAYFANARKRNVGWRIDYVCVSKKLKSKVKEAVILPDMLGSDHCPVGIRIKF